MPRTDSGIPRRRRRSIAVATGLAIGAPTLFLGGALARATEAPGAPESVSVAWTGPDGRPTGPGGVTTTRALPHVASAADATGTAPTRGSVGVSVSPGDSEDAGGSVEQSMVVSIPPGPLTVSPSSESVSVSLASVQFVDHVTPVYHGDLAPVTVVDARGSLVGWRASVSLHAVSGVDAGAASHALLCAEPRTPTMVAGNPGDAVRGAPRSCAGVGGTISLFSAAPGGGGGTYSDTAGLTLLLPGSVHTGTVTASLAVAVH